MRVVHVAPTMFGNDGLYGGGERFPLELARALSRRVDCELVTYGTPGRVQHADRLTIRVLEVRGHLRGHPAHPIATGLRAALRGADVIHTHHMRSIPSRTAAVIGKASPSRVVVTDHGLGGGGWGGLLPRLFDGFLTVSAYSAEVLGAPPGKTRVIYAGADLDRFSPEPRVERRGVLFVGRITPHKGIDVLIRAMPEDIPLTIVGTGGHDKTFPESDYPDMLRRLAAGKDVRFVDRVADAELPDLYRSHRVLVLPSVHETCYGKHVAISELLGLAMIEAMASGTPIVCSNIGGLPEVVEDGATGYVVPPGDVDSLRARIEELAGGTVRTEEMGRRARETVQQRFTWDACADRCVEAYRAVAGPA